jgi:hypothetical protein
MIGFASDAVLLPTDKGFVVGLFVTRTSKREVTRLGFVGWLVCDKKLQA